MAFIDNPTCPLCRPLIRRAGRASLIQSPKTGMRAETDLVSTRPCS
jgi:hypothetical protein